MKRKTKLKLLLRR